MPSRAPALSTILLGNVDELRAADRRSYMGSVAIGEVDAERRSAALAFLDPRAATVQFGETLDQGQPNPDAG